MRSGNHQFKGVWLSNTNTSEDFKNKWYIAKAAWVLNPGSIHLWEPYVSYYVWDPEIKQVGANAYGDATNFIRPDNLGKDQATLGKIKVTSVGINYWYDKASLLGWTLEYQKYDEERNEIDNDAITLQFRFVF